MRVMSHTDIEVLELNVETPFGDYRPFRYAVHPVDWYFHDHAAKRVLTKENLAKLDSADYPADKKSGLCDQIFGFTRPFDGSPILYKAVYMNEVELADRVAIAKEIIEKAIKKGKNNVNN